MNIIVKKKIKKNYKHQCLYSTGVCMLAHKHNKGNTVRYQESCTIFGLLLTTKNTVVLQQYLNSWFEYALTFQQPSKTSIKPRTPIQMQNYA